VTGKHWQQTGETVPGDPSRLSTDKCRTGLPDGIFSYQKIYMFCINFIHLYYTLKMFLIVITSDIKLTMWLAIFLLHVYFSGLRFFWGGAGLTT
jgi:hypothetical protein